MRRRVLRLFLSILGLCRCNIAAATSPPQLSVAEINDCIYEYWSGQLKAGVIATRTASALVRSTLLPSISSTLTTSKDFTRIQQQPPTNTGAITLNQQILNFANWLDISSKSLDEKAAIYDYENNLLALLKANITSVYSYLQLKSQEQLLVKRTLRLDKAVNLAKELNKLKISDQSVVFMTQSEKTQLEITLLTLKASELTTLNQIRAVSGVPANNQFEVTITENFKVMTDSKHWANKIDDLPELQSLKAKIESHRQEARSVRFEAMPTISLNASYSATYLEPTFNQPASVIKGIMTIPIFDQGSRSIRAQASESQAMVIESQIESKRLQLSFEIKNILNLIESYKRAIELSKQKLELSQKAYTGTWTLFSVGKSQFLSVKDAETSLIDAEIQLDATTLNLSQQIAILDLYDNYSEGRRISKGPPRTCQIQQ